MYLAKISFGYKDHNRNSEILKKKKSGKSVLGVLGTKTNLLDNKFNQLNPVGTKTKIQHQRTELQLTLQKYPPYLE